ncbi:MAG: hypothetical protein LJE94_13520 [Deltaproteobacteria bacterium]|nr:hypothetical protein [Deltaproteobacteria bacterium]
MVTIDTKDFVHPELNRSVKAIGGEYLFAKEAVLPFEGRDVLYLVGCALFDTTCCGAGGVCYARVAGFIQQFQYKTDESGRPVSLVVPVADRHEQQKIRRAISRCEPVQQVEF